MRKNVFLLMILSMALSACDNEVAINAPWRETPVIFAVLDLGQDTQVFRIQKTYQNGLNQTTENVAQIADSLYFKNISVKIVNNNIADTSTNYVVFKKSAPQKLPGFFSNKDSSYWSAVINKLFLRKLYTYTLVITNTETGKIYEAVSNVVDTATINRGPTYNPISIDLSNISNPNFSIYVENTGANSAIFDKLLRLNYTEAPVSNPTQTVTKSLDYVLKQAAITGTNAGIISSSVVSKVSYSNFIESSFTKDPTVIRKFSSIEVVVVSANSDYADMLQTNKPSGSIIPKVGQYSNITGAIGIFSSRTITKKEQVFTLATIDLVNTKLLNP
jgi:hypothetical protein